MVALLLLTLLQTAPAQPPPAQPAAAPATPAKPRPAAAASGLSLMLFVTDNEGRNLDDVTVTLMGPVDREVKTPPGTGVRIANLRSGTYRARFAREGFYTFEKEIVVRPGPTAEIPVTLNAAPRAPAPPPPAPVVVAPVAPAAPKLPPPGTPKTMSLLDFIDKNFISNREGHKENIVGCSGVGQAVLWQVREPWDGRQHESADGMLYVIGGEGSIKIDGRDIAVTAGGFAVVPRGTTYGFTRRGRNPMIVLAVLAGAPCAAE
jgi:mannose-6-phosphate isomerase-like protein (cupin superfamily)